VEYTTVAQAVDAEKAARDRGDFDEAERLQAIGLALSERNHWQRCRVDREYRQKAERWIRMTTPKEYWNRLLPSRHIDPMPEIPRMPQIATTSRSRERRERHVARATSSGDSGDDGPPLDALLFRYEVEEGLRCATCGRGNVWVVERLFAKDGTVRVVHCNDCAEVGALFERTADFPSWLEDGLS
jgi:hypothetical protein